MEGYQGRSKAGSLLLSGSELLFRIKMTVETAILSVISICQLRHWAKTPVVLRGKALDMLIILIES